ncbi:DapH/DapD/GlmU-related protein [Jatrophihabitans sp. YIM 134969]
MTRPGRLTRVLDARISRLKGGDYRLDPALAPADLLGEVGRRAVMRVRGRVAFPRRPHPPFVAAGARFVHRGKLHFGRGVTFGRDSHVDALSREGVRLGDNVNVGPRTRIEATGQLQHLGVGMVVGDDVGLGTDCFYGCAGGIEIGPDTIVGNWVGMHSENHRFERRDVPVREQGVTHQGIVVGRDCWIGAKVTVLDGVRLGDGAVVAAGAVLVAGDYPGHAVYGGVPARRIAER